LCCDGNTHEMLMSSGLMKKRKYLVPIATGSFRVEWTCTMTNQSREPTPGSLQLSAKRSMRSLHSADYFLYRGRRWSESIAVGGLSFVERVKIDLGARGFGRKITSSAAGHELREAQVSYGDHLGCEKAPL
jgi:hypothetical protein